MKRKALLTLTILGAATILLTPTVSIAALAVANYALTGKVENNEPTYIYGPGEAAQSIVNVSETATDTYPAAKKQTRQTTENPTISDSPEAWETEIWAVEASKQRLHGVGPTHHRPIDLTPDTKSEMAPDPFKILIVGDSYTSGSFQDITDNNYTRRLEQKLNQHAPGGYEIVTLATDLASFLRQSDWVTEETLAKIDPDIVILTYTVNRIYPNWLEAKYCTEFNTCVTDGQNRPYQDAFAHDFSMASAKWRIIMCLRADTSPISWTFRNVLYPYFTSVAEYLSPRYCTPERVNAGLDLPTERTGMNEDARNNPYLDDFEEYVRNVRQAVDATGKNVPTYVMNLAWTPDQMWPPLEVDGNTQVSTVGYLFELYRQYGFEEIPNPLTRATVTNLRTWELGNIQGTNVDLQNNNCVYNCTLTPEQWEKNKANYFAGAINHPLKYRPGWAIQESFARDLLAFVQSRHPQNPLSDPAAQPIVVDYTPWNLSVANTKDQATVQLSRWNSNVEPSASSAKYQIIAHTSCAAANHPHAVVALNQARMARAQKLTVSYNGGDYEKLLIAFQEENPDGKLTYRASVKLSPGEYFVLDRPENMRNVLIADPSRNCDQSPIKLNPFEITLTTS